MARSLAVDKDGNLSYCSVPPEMRGMRGCPHVGHQEEKESSEDFIKRITIEGNAYKWRSKAEKRLGESDARYRERLSFNQYLTVYENNTPLEEKDKERVEDFRRELSEDYRVENRDLQDKIILIIRSAEDAEYQHRIKEAEVDYLIPEAPEPVRDDLKHYISVITEEDGVKIRPKSLDAAVSIRREHKGQIDPMIMFQDERFDKAD